MKTKHAIALVPALALLLAGACNKTAETSFKTQKVERANITTTITATGTIEPVTSVEVGTQVSGIIDKIYVDYNSIVKKGQVIAELDKTNLQSELSSAQSNLRNAQSNLSYQKANYNRYKTLYEKGLVSANDFESARLSYQQAVAQVQIQQQAVHKAQTNLGYATITAPIDGIVLSKEVEEGQTVASSMTTPTLFIIAKNLTDMRVIADVDEADIGDVKVGQKVTFTVDAYPEDTFTGSVTQVRQEATTESNVVTYEVVISAPNDDLKLKPGLTANVTVYTQEKNNVLTVPAKALRFTPNQNMLAKGQKLEDCNGTTKVWTKQGNTIRAIAVKTGISNGILTEVSGVAEGTPIITEISATAQADESDSQSDNNPFMPGPPDKNKKKNASSSSSSSSTQSTGSNAKAK